MTKAITTVAALQLVEQGKVRLDEPASKHLPQLEKLNVLEGFDPNAGKPILPPARTSGDAEASTHPHLWLLL